jgi:hypothetical protein
MLPFSIPHGDIELEADRYEELEQLRLELNEQDGLEAQEAEDFEGCPF